MDRTRNPKAGGAAIALLAVAGAFVGARNDQPTLGLLAGFAAGVAIALALWLWERRG